MKTRSFYRRIIPLLMFLLFISEGFLAGQYYIYMKGEWLRMYGQRREGPYNTLEEAQRAQKAMARGGVSETQVFDNTEIKGTPVVDTSQPPSTTPPGSVPPVTRTPPVSPKPSNPEVDNISGRIKGRTTGEVSFDGDGKDIAARIKGGTTPVSSSGGDGKDLSSRIKGGTTPPSSSGGGGKDIGSRLKPGNTSGFAAKPMDWSAKSALWIEELAHINRQLAVTRSTLLKLNELILADRKLFAEWEKEANEGFDRCVEAAVDIAMEASVGYLVERYDEINRFAVNLPDKQGVEKYRRIASLFHRLVEARATKDYAGLAAREGKTDAEIYEILRDGIGQISGLVGLDKTLPGWLWKFGSLGFDMAYNLTELRLVWKNVSALEANNVGYAQAVMVLSNRMRELQARQAQLVKNIEAGEPGKGN